MGKFIGNGENDFIFAGKKDIIWKEKFPEFVNICSINLIKRIYQTCEGIYFFIPLNEYNISEINEKQYIEQQIDNLNLENYNEIDVNIRIYQDNPKNGFDIYTLGDSIGPTNILL